MFCSSVLAMARRSREILLLNSSSHDPRTPPYEPSSSKTPRKTLPGLQSACQLNSNARRPFCSFYLASGAWRATWKPSTAYRVQILSAVTNNISLLTFNLFINYQIQSYSI